MKYLQVSAIRTHAEEYEYSVIVIDVLRQYVWNVEPKHDEVNEEH